MYQYWKFSSPSLLLSFGNFFLSITADSPSIQRDIIHQLKGYYIFLKKKNLHFTQTFLEPLLTLYLTEKSFEMIYLILLHIHLMSSYDPSLFSLDYKYFYCKMNDPPYIKKLKIQLLITLAQEKNGIEIVDELSEYVKETNSNISRWAIQALGSLTCKGIGLLSIVIQQLLSFLNLQIDFVSSMIIIIFYGLKY